MEFRESPPVSIHAEASSNLSSRGHSTLKVTSVRCRRSQGSRDGCARVDGSSPFVDHTPVPHIGTRRRRSTRLPTRVRGAIEGGTAREARKAAATSEFDAALFLHERSEELRHKVRAEKSAADQLPRSVLASTAPGTCEPSFKGHPLGRTPRNRNATAGPQLLRTSSGGPGRRWVSSWQLSQATIFQEVEGVRALFGPESEESIVASPGWPCGTSSPTSLPSAS